MDFVDACEDTAARLTDLGRSLVEDDWALPTDLPGWTVTDVYAHLAAVESELIGEPLPEVTLPDGLAHVRDAWGQHMERGVQHRRARAGMDIVDEFTRCIAVRTATLRADPPTDPAAPVDRAPAGAPWSWQEFLCNRVIDLWMHEQDVRRAVGRPGGLQSPGAEVTVATFAAALPYVLGKRIKPPAGTTAVWEVTGPVSLMAAVRMNETGRAAALPAPPDPADVRLVMDTETFVILGGGRLPPETVDVRIEGDAEFGMRLLGAMSVTP
jgi:uncharacterized protein (TIGR03083 family)